MIQSLRISCSQWLRAARCEVTYAYGLDKIGTASISSIAAAQTSPYPGSRPALHDSAFNPVAIIVKKYSALGRKMLHNNA